MSATFQPIPVQLTKRELFAAMAMQGMQSALSSPEIVQAIAMLAGKKGTEAFVAESAVSLADALLAELEKTP